MKISFTLAAASLLLSTAAVRPSIAQDVATPARHLTLDEAQRVPVQANAAVARLGQLSVEAAEHHRKAVAADYFPKVSATAWNLHFNEFMGQQINVVRPLGSTVTAGFPLLGQDQSFVAFNAIQPLTPIFKVRQAVNLARADENIARGKAGLPVEESRHAMTKAYFDLLIAQKQLALAEAKVRKARAGRLVASTAPSVVNARLDAEPAADLADLAEDVIDLSGRVRTLTAALNDKLGWPAATPLELEAPAPLLERITLAEAVEQALAANPEVIEAEQNVQKARAGTKLSKLDYVPDIAVIGGWAAQNEFIPLLPDNFAYVGVFGTYNIFDFGKREQTVKERSTQLEMARTALDLTRGKVAAAVKTGYLELERSRTLFQLASARATGADIQVVHFGALEVRAADDDQIALEQIRLDWRHRQAYADLKAAIGGR